MGRGVYQMKFFDRWLLKKLKYCWDHADEIEGNNKKYSLDEVCVDLEESPSLRTRGTRFTMYNANGGMVIETDFYDDKTDRRTNNLYVCSNTENLGEELSKILTLESLKR